MSPVRSGTRAVQPGGLAAALGLPQQPHAARRELRDDLVGAVVGAVGDDDDLAPVGRIVERQRVLELGADDAASL